MTFFPWIDQAHTHLATEPLPNVAHNYHKGSCKAFHTCPQTHKDIIICFLWMGWLVISHWLQSMPSICCLVLELKPSEPTGFCTPGGENLPSTSCISSTPPFAHVEGHHWFWKESPFCLWRLPLSAPSLSLGLTTMRYIRAILANCLERYLVLEGYYASLVCTNSEGACSMLMGSKFNVKAQIPLCSETLPILNPSKV